MERSEDVAKADAVRDGKVTPEDAHSRTPAPSSGKGETADSVAKDQAGQDAPPPEQPDDLGSVFDGFTAADLEAGYEELIAEAEAVEPVRLADGRTIEPAPGLHYALAKQAHDLVYAAGGGLAGPVPFMTHEVAPITCEEEAATVVAAIQYYEQVAAQVREQAARIAGHAERKAAFIEKMYTPSLAALLEERLAAGGKKSAKSIELMTGMSAKPPRLAIRKTAERLVVDEPDEAVLWVLQNYDPKDAGSAPDPAEAIKVVPEQRKPVHAVLAKHWKATGEVPNGCHVEEADEVFKIQR